MLPLARHLQARPLQGGNHRGAIRDGPRFDALAQIVGNQPPGVFLCLQPGPKLRGLDVGPMAGLHVPRPLEIVRTAPAVLVVLPVPQRVKRLLPSGSRDIQALAGLKIAARRQDMHVDTPTRFAVLDRCPGVAVRFEARPGGFLELVHHAADLRIARVVLRCPADDGSLPGYTLRRLKRVPIIHETANGSEASGWIVGLQLLVARIVQRGNTAMQKGKDTPCRLLIELAQLADGGAVKLDLPGHSVP